MLFNSISYMVFLPIVFAIYWILPHRFRIWLVFIASYYFYMCWNVKYVLLIAFTTFVSWIAAIWLEKIESESNRKKVLLVAILLCLSVLLVFKYYNFFFESLEELFELFSIHIHPVTVKFMIPVGISFYTFQTISYVADVYNRKIRAEKNIITYATFVSFFPQLVAGPIERTENLLPQIKARHVFNYGKAIEGVKLMLWGYYKKLVIADNIAVYVDVVWDNMTYYHGLDKMLAIFFFSIQIYCDFSGYSDIAIGSAKLLDIDLMTNFKAPYLSSSIKDFWSRWHISLSSWLKDYIYIPLGGNRCSKKRNIINLMTTFLISGLWHGANWTYVVWGAMHGVFQVVESALKKPLNYVKRWNLGKVIMAICIYVFCTFAWVFFRAENFSSAIQIIVGAFEDLSNIKCYLSSQLISFSQLLVLVIGVMILGLHDCVDAEIIAINGKIKNSLVINWGIYIFLGVIILFGTRKDVAADFIYFQF